MKAYWADYDRHNFGDWLTPYIIKKITGVFPEHSKAGRHFILAGSILQEINGDSVVIGAGFGARSQRVKTLSAEIWGVRGPISRQMLVAQGYNMAGTVQGDPGLVLPIIYPKRVKPDIDLGIFPHYVDVGKFKDSGYFVIDPHAPIETVLAQLLRCRRVVTSSLHGLIVSHVYGIPALLAAFGGAIAGDGMKYQDYFMSVGIQPYSPKQIKKEDVHKQSIPSQISKTNVRLYQLIERRLRG